MVAPRRCRTLVCALESGAASCQKRRCLSPLLADRVYWAIPPCGSRWLSTTVCSFGMWPRLALVAWPHYAQSQSRKLRNEERVRDGWQILPTIARDPAICTGQRGVVRRLPSGGGGEA